MPRPPHSKRKRTRSPRKKAEQPESPAPSTPPPTPPQDLPDPDTVLAEVPFTSPKGHTYRILITDQTDPYDPPPSGNKKKRNEK